MVVELQLQAPLPQLCSFARWLPKHVQLIHSMTATAENLGDTIHGVPRDQYVEMAQLLLQPALLTPVTPAAHLQQSAASSRAECSTTNGDTSAAARHQQQLTQQQQQQNPMRLASFSTNWLATPAVLAALPAHSLTCLQLAAEYSSQVDGAALSAAIARLSSLQQLHLSSGLARSCASSIAQLSRLTSLTLHACLWGRREEQVQWLVQQPLPLKHLSIQSLVFSTLPRLDMTALTSLTELSMPGISCDELVVPHTSSA
jgi:hypothetical protein